MYKFIDAKSLYIVIFEIPYGSKADVGQIARSLLAPGSHTYNNNKHSTYLQFPLCTQYAIVNWK